MHVKHKPQGAPIKVSFEGKTYLVTMDADGAFLPNALGEHMIKLGLVVRDDDSNPKPQWAVAPGGGCGDLIPPFSPWVRELN